MTSFRPGWRSAMPSTAGGDGPGTSDARLLHARQHQVTGDGVGLLRLVGSARRPRPVARVGAPDVDLRVDDQHAVLRTLGSRKSDRARVASSRRPVKPWSTTAAAK